MTNISTTNNVYPCAMMNAKKDIHIFYTKRFPHRAPKRKRCSFGSFALDQSDDFMDLAIDNGLLAMACNTC